MTTALLVTLTACGGAGDEGSEDAVKDAAQEQADRYSSGDFAGAWDMWVDRAKDVMSQDEYVTYSEACSNGGLPLDVDMARIEEDGTATVRIGLGDFKSSYKMEFEDHEWSWVPNDDSLARYELGAEGAIADAKADGSCVED